MSPIAVNITGQEKPFPQMGDCEEVSARIVVMLGLESSPAYRRTDYLGKSLEISPLSENPLRREPPSAEEAVDNECRIKMCEWCHQILDFCGFQRETISIAMSYVDRYLSSERGQSVLFDRKAYQLLSITALYMAIKFVEPLELELSTLSELSRGAYSEHQFVEMERSILSTLEWRLTPITPIAVVQHLLSLLPNSTIRDAIYDASRYQIELCVSNYDIFAQHTPSEIALTSILNSCENVD